MQFNFGKNWKDFSKKSLDAVKVAQARNDFKLLLGDLSLNGKSFLDIGFGQGLTLMLASEMGAQTLGIDINAENKDALQMTGSFFSAASLPETRIISILNNEAVNSLSAIMKFDVVHSWGVLHHTGDMKLAVQNAASLVKNDGYLILAIYNYHWTSPIWLCIKWLYNMLPAFLQKVMVGAFYPVIYIAKWLVTGKNPKQQSRGMDFYYDVIDWVGGYPYEYERIPDTIKRLQGLGFECVKSIPANVPTGCNQFVFKKINKAIFA